MILCLRSRLLQSSCLGSTVHKVEIVYANKSCCSKLRTISAASNTEKSAPAFADNSGVKAKPFSEIPGDTRHWTANVLEIFFTNGGVQKSLYKIHEKIFR